MVVQEYRTALAVEVGGIVTQQHHKEILVVIHHQKETMEVPVQVQVKEEEVLAVAVVQVLQALTHLELQVVVLVEQELHLV